MMIVRVRRAPSCLGSRKMGTPLLTASMPVIAVHPLANARVTSQADAVATAAPGGAGNAATGGGCGPSVRTRTAPTTRTRSMLATKR